VAKMPVAGQLEPDHVAARPISTLDAENGTCAVTCAQSVRFSVGTSNRWPVRRAAIAAQRSPDHDASPPQQLGLGKISEPKRL